LQKTACSVTLRHKRVRTYLQSQDETRERLERAMRHYLAERQLKLQTSLPAWKA
jgi:hypothetical protein